MKKGLSTCEMPDFYHESYREGKETYGDSGNYRDKARIGTGTGKEYECSFSDLIEDITDWKALFYHGVRGGGKEGHGEETGKRKLLDLAS